MRATLFAYGKKAGALVASAVTSIVWVCGLIAIPQAIEFFQEQGWTWATSPKFLWTAFILMVEGSVVVWIPKQPDTRSESVVWKLPPDTPMQTRLLVQLLEDMQQFYIGILEHDPTKPINAHYVLSVLECVFHPRIRDLLGADVSARYLSTVKSTAKKTKHVQVVCRAAIPLAEQAIWKELERVAGLPTQHEVTVPLA